MLLLMLSEKIIEFWAIRPILCDPECTEMYREILMPHNIKNYEQL